MIVDTHAHVVAGENPRYPWKPMSVGVQGVSSEWHKQGDHTVEALLPLSKKAGVDRLVLVQALTAYSDDNSYAADCQARHREATASVGVVDTKQGDAASRLRYWVKERGVRGVRLLGVSDADAAWLDDPRTYPVWEEAQSLGVPVTALTGPRHLGRVEKMAQRYPKVRVALDHMGFPMLKDGLAGPGGEALLGLAKLPNIYLKFSTMTLDTARAAGVAPAEVLRKVFAAFGAKRMLWGSNYPATQDRPYAQMVAEMQEALTFLSEEERRWAMGESALALWPELRGKG